MAVIKEITRRGFLQSFTLLVAFVFTVLGVVDSISVEKDLSMTLREKQILDKFRAQMTPLLEHDYMKTDIYLVRWLRAKKFNIRDAEQMLKKNLQWRKNKNMDTIQSEDFTDMFQDLPTTLDTYDKEGRPIATVEMYNWDIRQAALSGRGPRALRYLDMVMDNVTKQVFELQQKGVQVTQFKCLFNAEGFSLTRHGCAACIPYWIQFLSSLENHFVGFVDEFILIEGNFAVNTILGTLRPFLSEQLRDTFRIFSTNRKEWMEYLDKRIARDQRRAPYGGTKV